MKLRGFVIPDFFDEAIDDQGPEYDVFMDKVDDLEADLEGPCFIGQDDAKHFVAVKPAYEHLLNKHFSYPIQDMDKDDYPWDQEGEI